MPNHITNRIKFLGDRNKVEKMLEQIKSDKYGTGTIDFNKIIPMPKELDIEAGSRTDNGLRAYKDFIDVYTLGGTVNRDLDNIPSNAEDVFLRMRTDVKREEFELGRQAYNNLQKYGVKNWYDWCVGNWGTKWNAYGYEDISNTDTNDEIWFQTAWDAPHPVIERLAQDYPDITFGHEWADEDIGVNCGRRIYSDGEIIDEYFPEYGRESMEFAAQVMDLNLSDLGLFLNATKTKYISVEYDEYEVVEVLGKTALFSNERLTAEDIPYGMYCYHLRESDDGERFATVESRVGVNCGGTIITKSPLDLGKNGVIVLNEDNAPNFTGEKATFNEYITGDFEQQNEGMVIK